MTLLGHGRVVGLLDTVTGDRILIMNWSTQHEVIEVPLLACNEIVNFKSQLQVDGVMPELF